MVLAVALLGGGCGERSHMLQYQQDVARDRGWMLTSAGVSVVDLRSGRTMAQVRLPDWHWAGQPFGCTPTLAVGPTGEALVSSDVVPTLWRVDPQTLAVSRHDLDLEEGAGQDIGFAALAYSAKLGAFVATACAQGSPWRIDASLTKGQRMSLRSTAARS